MSRATSPPSASNAITACRSSRSIETVVETYLGLRLNRDEKFLDAYRRVGAAPFKEALYGAEAKAA